MVHASKRCQPDIQIAKFYQKGPIMDEPSNGEANEPKPAETQVQQEQGQYNSTPPIQVPTRDQNPTWYTRDGRLRGSDVPVPGRCGRKLPRTKPPRYCMKPKRRGFDACIKHYGGGHLQRGIMAPAFKHGKACRNRYDKYLSGQLKEMYDEAEADQQYLSLASEIALGRTMIADLLAKMDRGQGNDLWKRLIKVHQELARAIKTTDVAMMQGAVAELAKVIELGAADRDVRQQLQQAILTVTKAARGEWKRLHDLGQFLPREMIEKLMLVENKLLVEIFQDKEKVREFRKRMQVALLPIVRAK